MASERSLQRIGAERFDLLLLHNPDRTGYTSAAVWEGMAAVRDAGLTRLLGVAPGPANGFTLDLIDCFERYGELIDWSMIILNPLEPWPGELALAAAAANDVELIARVVDYGGLFHDDVLPGHAFAEYDHRKFRPRRLGRAGPCATRPAAPLRRASRDDDAPTRLRVGPRARAGALRRAYADPGERCRRSRDRAEARRARRCAQPLAAQRRRGAARSARSARTAAR